MTTETEIELGNVVAFPDRKTAASDELVIQHEGRKILCVHDAVMIDPKERTLRCRRCNSLVEPFEFVLGLSGTESRYSESVKRLRVEEKQRRQNIEKLIQIEKNAKARIRKAGHKEPLPLWENERVES